MIPMLVLISNAVVKRGDTHFWEDFGTDLRHLFKRGLNR